MTDTAAAPRPTPTTVRLEGGLTKREVLLFEDTSGMSIEAVQGLLADPERPKMRVAMTLIFIALRRRLPAITFDEVLEGDYVLEIGTPDLVGGGTGPLPPPSSGDPTVPAA